MFTPNREMHTRNPFLAPYRTQVIIFNEHKTQHLKNGRSDSKRYYLCTNEEDVVVVRCETVLNYLFFPVLQKCANHLRTKRKIEITCGQKEKSFHHFKSTKGLKCTLGMGHATPLIEN